jgi:hypothetical protein
VPEENLNLNKACEYLQIPRKHLDNYAKIGHELSITKIRNRNYISIENLDSWKAQREFSYATFDRDDYLKCLDFAIRSFYQYKSTSDFGTSQQRDAGKFISNFVSGKLGEIAVSKFLKKNFDIDISLDFDLRDAVVGQDIVEIAKPRRGSRVYNPARLRVAIKTTKMKNVWLIVPQKEVEDSSRASDIYVSCRVDLYLNHFIRILREHASLTKLSDIIPQFESIQGEVCGFIKKRTLQTRPPVRELPEQDQAIGSSYVWRTGELLKKREDWIKLIDKL